jgi:hypothetical protein
MQFTVYLVNRGRVVVIAYLTVFADNFQNRTRLHPVYNFIMRSVVTISIV